MSYKTRLCILIIIIGSCIGYAGSLRNTFVYDDYMVLVHNHYIRSIENLPRLFSHDYFLVSNERTFRPISPMVLFLEYAVFGDHPAGYHVLNLLIHTLNALLLFMLMRLLLCSRLCAFVASLGFAIHPAISETIFCVSYLEDLWGMMFYLLALIGYLRFRKSGRWLDATILYAGFFLSMLTKEMGATILMIIPLIEYMWYRKTPATRKTLLNAILPLCVLMGIYLYMRFFWIYLPEKQASYPGDSLWITIMNMPRVFWHYVKLCFLPTGLTADYDFPIHHGVTLPIIASWLATGAGVVIFQKASWRIRFFMMWFIVNFLPVSNIIPFGAVVAERYLYFSIIGFAGIAGIFFDATYRWLRESPKYNRLKYVVPLVVCIAAVSYCVLLNVRTPAWYSDETLWFATVKYSPKKFIQKPTLFVNLGNVYYRNGDFDNALKAYKYARKIDPDIPGIHNNIGVIYMEQGYLDMAKSEFLSAIAMNDSFTDAYFSLAKLYMQRNQLEQAQQTIEKVLKIDRDSMKAHKAMVVICTQLGKVDTALAHCYHLIERDPLNEFAYYNAGVLYVRTGRIDLAEQVVRQGLKTMPDSKDLKHALSEVQKARASIKE